MLSGYIQGSTSAVIANNPSRGLRIPWSKALHRERNLIERCFLRPKNFRRVVTRYDKTAESFLAFVASPRHHPMGTNVNEI